MKVAMIMNVILIYVLGGAMSSVWNMVNTLQLIIMMGYLPIKLASCFYNVMTIMLKLV